MGTGEQRNRYGGNNFESVEKVRGGKSCSTD